MYFPGDNAFYWLARGFYIRAALVFCIFVLLPADKNVLVVLLTFIFFLGLSARE